LAVAAAVVAAALVAAAVAVAAAVVAVAAVVVVVVAVAVVAEGGEWNHETEQNHEDETLFCRRLAWRMLFSISKYPGNDCTECS
jgi:hypothetical protein